MYDSQEYFMSKSVLISIFLGVAIVFGLKYSDLGKHCLCSTYVPENSQECKCSHSLEFVGKRIIGYLLGNDQIEEATKLFCGRYDYPYLPFEMAYRTSPDLPITGELGLKFGHDVGAHMNFSLSNQTSRKILFRGDYSEDYGGAPNDYWFECVDPVSNRIEKDRIQGGTEESGMVDVAPGRKTNLIFGLAYLDYVAGRIKLIYVDKFIERHLNQKCRLFLNLEDGSTISSDEFKP